MLNKAEKGINIIHLHNVSKSRIKIFDPESVAFQSNVHPHRLHCKYRILDVKMILFYVHFRVPKKTFIFKTTRNNENIPGSQSKNID